MLKYTTNCYYHIIHKIQTRTWKVDKALLTVVDKGIIDNMIDELPVKPIIICDNGNDCQIIGGFETVSTIFNVFAGQTNDIFYHGVNINDIYDTFKLLKVMKGITDKDVRTHLKRINSAVQRYPLLVVTVVDDLDNESLDRIRKIFP